MTTNERLLRTWSDADFDTMSWHDNHIHGLALRPGTYGIGELVLDLDYILRWVREPDGGIAFEIAPARLTFHQATELTVALDYAGQSAAMGAFSIDGIERSQQQRQRYTATVWRVPVNWPAGCISFVAAGFTQVQLAPALRKTQQVLDPDERTALL